VLAIVSRVVYTLVVLVLLTATGLGLTAGLVALVASAVVLGLGSLAALLRQGGIRLDRHILGGMFSYGARNQLSLVFQAVNYRLDVLILQFFRPLNQIGYYVVAQIVAELAISWSRSFQGVLPIVSSEPVEERRVSTTISSLHHHGILAAGTLIGTAVLGPLVIVVGFGADFRAAVGPMLALLPGIWFLGTGTVAGSNLAGLGRPGLPAALAGVAAVVTVGLDLTLIPVLGIYGAVIASVSSYTTYGVGSLIALSRVSNIPIRALLIPTRDDLRLYPAAAIRLLGGLRRA
jgi:O-antigen/teichoic acid export membrane protein